MTYIPLPKNATKDAVLVEQNQPIEIDDTTPINVAEQGTTSTNNTTITPLAGGATFTGVADLNDRPDAMVSCYSDTDGTLYFDFSVNGTDWRTFPVNGFVVKAGIHEFHTAVKGGRYFRIRFINGASAQSVFQLYTYYGQYRLPSAPLNQSVGLDADAILTKSIPWWMLVARGLFSGISDVKKFGRNDSVGTSFTPITIGGVYQTPQASGATTLRVKAGGNANDTAAGTGAREITLQGLDENFNIVSETLATAGASASSYTVATFTRLYRVFVSNSGTYASAAAGSHSGDIVVEDGTNDWATIDATGFPKGQSEIGAFSVPANTTGYAKLRNISIDSGKTVDVLFFARTDIDQTAPPYSAMRAQSVVSGVAGGSIEVFGETEVPFGPYTGPTDIGFMAKTSAGSAAVAVEFEIFIIDDA